MWHALGLPAVALASMLALVGCSTMAQHAGAGPGQAGGLATGFGVTSSEITLGALTDYTGPFAALGLGVVQGNQIWINETTAVALSQSSELLNNPYVIIPGTTYDVEMINGLSALMAQGKIRDGDTIGHIWVDGEYGANGLRGAQYFAEKHHLTVRDAPTWTLPSRAPRPRGRSTSAFPTPPCPAGSDR